MGAGVWELSAIARRDADWEESHGLNGELNSTTKQQRRVVAQEQGRGPVNPGTGEQNTQLSALARNGQLVIS